MKLSKYLLSAVLAALAMASCAPEKIEPQEPEPAPEGFVARATLPPDSRVFFEENSSGGLHPSWQKGDLLRCFLTSGENFNFEVSSVDPSSGVATLVTSSSHEFTPGETVFALYMPDSCVSEYKGGCFDVNLASQGAEGIPAMMLSEAVVQDGPSLHFTMRNGCSVIGIVNPAIGALNANRNLSKVIVSGHELVSAGKVSVEAGALKFEAAVPTVFIEKTVDAPMIASASGISVENPIYIAVPPCRIAKITLVDSKGYIYSYEVNKDAEASTYYRVKDRSFEAVTLPVNTEVLTGGVYWSDRNLGATTVTSGMAAWGDAYQWGNDAILYDSKDYNSKTVVLKSEYSAGYAAVTGLNYYNGSTYSKYNETDGKTVLDPVDDVVQLTYPGSGWRMPTIDECNSLTAAASSGSLLSQDTGGSTSYIKYADASGNTVSFVRTYGLSAKAFDTNRGRYWTSSVVSAESDAKRFLKAHYFRINSANTTSGTNLRHLGYYVRPVLPEGSGPGSGSGGGGYDEPDLPNYNAGRSVAGLPEWNEISVDYTNLTAANHPRLFLRAKDIKTISTRVAGSDYPYLNKLHASIMAGADALVKNTGALKYEITSGGQLLQVSRKALTRIADLAYAYRITGDDKYLQMADFHINTVCDFPDWHSEHFLDVAEMATAVAIGYDWLYCALPAATLEKARDRLKSYALELASSSNVYSQTGNWNQVCLGGLMCAALAVYEDYPSLCDEVVRKALASNAKEVKAIFAPMGACPEGPGYWEYGTTYQGILNLACETALGTDFELPSVEGFSHAGDYYMFVRGNSGKRFNYSDSGEKDEASLGMWYIAYAKGNGSYLYQDISHLDDGSFSSDPYSFMAMTCCVKMGSFSVTPPSGKIYKSDGANPVLMCRTGWTSDDLYLALKAGMPNINHAHMDVGEVVFDAFGTRWFKDFTYSTDYGELRDLLTASGQSTDQLGNREVDSWRWKIFQYINLSHSTITVNMQNHWPFGCGGVSSISESGRIGGKADLSNALYNQLSSAYRTAVIRDGSYLEIVDELTSLNGKAASVRWTCASDAAPEVVSDGIVLTDGNGVKMKLSTDAPGAVFSVWPADPAQYPGYTSPFTETAELKQNPLDGYLCGFEFSIPAGTKCTVTTTLKKM